MGTRFDRFGPILVLHSQTVPFLFLINLKLRSEGKKRERFGNATGTEREPAPRQGRESLPKPARRRVARKGKGDFFKDAMGLSHIEGVKSRENAAGNEPIRNRFQSKPSSFMQLRR